MKVSFARVGDLAEQIRGVTYGKEDASRTPTPGYLPVLRAGNITDSGLVFDDLVYVPAAKVAAKQKIRKGDIVIAASSGSLDVVGKAAPALAAFDGGFGAFCKVIRPTSKVDAAYLAQFFKTPGYRRTISSLAAGANINNLKSEHLDDLQIPLPPLPEQRRIAAILDQADALRAKRREALAHLDSLTQSMFIEMTNGSGFGGRRMRIEDAMAAIIDYRGKTPTKTDVGVPLVTARVVKNGELLEPNEYIAEEDYKAWMRRGLPMPGDVLFTTEAPLGEVAQLDDRRVALAQRLLLLRGKPGLLDNTYLKFALTSQVVRSQIEARATGSTVKGIRQSELREVEIPVPPLRTQTEFAGRVRRLEVLRKQLRASASEMAALFASLQHRAFAGQLS